MILVIPVLIVLQAIPTVRAARLLARFGTFSRSIDEATDGSLTWLASIFARCASSIWWPRAPVRHGAFTVLDRPFAIACQAAPHHRDGLPSDRCGGDYRSSLVTKGAAFWESDVHRGARGPVFCHGVSKSRAHGYLSATKRELGSVAALKVQVVCPIERRSIS
jgi:hypothetical protein